MKKVLFTLLALVAIMSEANAQVGYTISLIEQGYDDYNYTKSIALTALNPGVTETEDVYAGIVGGECPPIYPGATVTLTIGVDKGWFVHEVKAYTSIETDQMQSPRRSSDVSLLTQVPVTKGDGNTWTFTMPEANVQLYIKYLNTPPYFVDAENIKLVVPENTVRATAGTIKAIDDQGDGFTFEIMGGTGEDLFDIGLKTGIVTMKAGVEPFDYEAWKDAGGVGYTLEVGVCDTRAAQFDEVFGTSHTFTVTISDVNEEPYFTNETDVIYIAEGAAASTDMVTYADKDKYATGEFLNNELAIISDESNLFEISADGHIKTKEGVVLDYETQKDKVYTIEVRVRDANKDTDGQYVYPDFYEDKTFKVKVSDVNEAPIFKAEAYTYELLATERTEQVLGTVETTDPDIYATDFSTITYSLEGDDAANFKIDATTGKISLKDGTAFNYAEKSVYSFNAVASDKKNKVSVPVTVTLSRKPLTITAQSHAFTYTGAAQTWAQYDVEGLVGDDAITVVVTGSITLPAESPVANKIESYEFTKGTAGNYTVTTVDGELTMTAANVAITITAASQEWTYDGTAHSNTAVTITSGELLTGDELVATASGAATNVADTKAGNNPVAEGYKVMHGEEDVTANYAITAVAGTLTIKPKAVTITAQSHTFAYTGETQTWPQYDVEGLVGDDAITAVVTGSITLPTESPVVNKLESYEFTKGTASNYTVTTVDGELTMTAASVAITLTAGSGEWTYDGTAHSNTAVTITSGELLAGDVLVAEATGAATNVADTKAGNNPIAEGYKVMHGETDVTANYAITTVAGTLTINPKAVTITAQNHAFIYNGKAQTWPKYDVEGLVGDDAITAVVTGSVTYYVNEVVANKIESYEFTKGTASNYTVTTKDGNLIISKASVYITGGITVSKEVNNGEATYTVDCSHVEFDGLVGDDKITVSGIKVMAVETNEDGTETVTLDFTDMKCEGDHVDCYYILVASKAKQVTVAKTTETTAEVAADGTKTETTVSKETNADGGITEVTVETTKEASGKEVVTETTTETDADGNIVASTENKTEKNTDGSTTETSKTYASSGGSGGGGSSGGGGGGGSSSGGGGGVSVTTESKTTKNANGEVTSSTTSKEEKDADGKLIASESSNYEKHPDGSKTESENKMWLDEEACKHETGSLKETDQGAAAPWHESESETLYDQFGMFTEEKTNESWKDLEDGTVFELEQHGCVEEITGVWKEHNIGILWDGDGDPWCKQESTLVKDEHDGTVLSRLDTEEWKDKETGNTILMDSKMPELTGSGEDYVALEWTDEDEANFNAWLKEGSIPDGSDDASLSQFESTWNENAADNFNVDLALRAGDQQNVDLCVTAVKNAQDATTSKNSSINVRQSVNTTKLVVSNVLNGSKKVKTLKVTKAEIKKGAFREMAQVKRITPSPKTPKICVPNRLLKKVVKKHSPSRAPEEESGDVPEGYIEIESGEEYEVLTDEPIVLTIDTEGEPMEITSIMVTQDDISTAIRTIDTASGKTTDEWYTIDGRKLDKAPTAKGIYIVNGKKVAVK